jgi:hypothetical protein
MLRWPMAIGSSKEDVAPQSLTQQVLPRLASAAMGAGMPAARQAAVMMCTDADGPREFVTPVLLSLP